jgi:hypothetical protein
MQGRNHVFVPLRGEIDAGFLQLVDQLDRPRVVAATGDDAG